MGCSGCGVKVNGVPSGCGDKGHCTSGGCNKHNTYDWIAAKDISDPSAYQMVEVSFKNGSHKEFFINEPYTKAVTGDMVVVETTSGYDVGRISLSGELVRLQMKKKRYSEDRVIHKVVRKANERDIEKLEEARALEQNALVRARAIARTMGLDMKLGDVEYQGDKKKATFYYTAEGRVDFRELVKEYAREFKVKIEMRQIGARQESGRIGGIGSCGRELCCSTWLSDFKSVNTSAARYQNIAINQSKLSGQCGRLKCCLNYELDTYLDALEDFPEDADVLKTKAGTLVLIKTDIFKRLLYYAYENNDKMRGVIIGVTTDRAKEVRALNLKNIYPDELKSDVLVAAISSDPDDENVSHDYEDVTGLIELRQDPKRKKNRPSKQRPHQNNQGQNSSNPTTHQNSQGQNSSNQRPHQNNQRRGQDNNASEGNQNKQASGAGKNSPNQPNKPNVPHNSPEGQRDSNIKKSEPNKPATPGANNQQRRKKKPFKKFNKPNNDQNKQE